MKTSTKLVLGYLVFIILLLGAKDATLWINYKQGKIKTPMDIRKENYHQIQLDRVDTLFIYDSWVELIMGQAPYLEIMKVKTKDSIHHELYGGNLTLQVDSSNRKNKHSRHGNSFLNVPDSIVIVSHNSAILIMCDSTRTGYEHGLKILGENSDINLHVRTKSDQLENQIVIPKYLGKMWVNMKFGTISISDNTFLHSLTLEMNSSTLNLHGEMEIDSMAIRSDPTSHFNIPARYLNSLNLQLE